MDFPYGKIIAVPPAGFVPRQQWPEYLPQGDTPATMHPACIGDAPKGRRWGLWPLIFEEYISDEEPDLAASDKGGAPARIIFWRRIARTDKPKDWYRLSNRPSQVEGFAELRRGADYWHAWDESARRYRTKWLSDFNNRTHAIERIDYPEFKRQYLTSSVAPKAGSVQLDALERLLAEAQSGPHTELRGVRDLRTQELLAGMATVHSPTYSSSYYQAGFVARTAGNASFMIGLFDRWYEESLAKGVRYLHFGGFWHPGKPKRAWQGFSAFKAKFGLQYVAYQPELVRLRARSVR